MNETVQNTVSITEQQFINNKNYLVHVGIGGNNLMQ
jgi:hypothetical protein